MPKVSTSTVKSAGVTVDLEDFRKLARQLRKADRELNLSVKRMLRAMGAEVADEAKSKASEFSTQIPPGIAVRLSGMTVAVVSKTELGVLEEVGGKSHPGVTWRHPVFGNRDASWVVQHTHPYLLPALRDKSEEVESATARIVGLVLDRALEE